MAFAVLFTAPWDGGQTCGTFLKALTALTLFQLGLSLPYPLPPHPVLIDTGAGSDMI